LEKFPIFFSQTPDRFDFRISGFSHFSPKNPQKPVLSYFLDISKKKPKKFQQKKLEKVSLESQISENSGFFEEDSF